MVFHEKAVYQTQELSKEDEVPPLEFPVSETQREEEEFEDQILDDTENPSEELLEVPPYKRRSAWHQESKKLKAPPGTFKEIPQNLNHMKKQQVNMYGLMP